MSRYEVFLSNDDGGDGDGGDGDGDVMIVILVTGYSREYFCLHTVWEPIYR